MRETHHPARLAILLASVAGFVDAAGYIVLHGIFVAHITGDTNLLGQRLGRGDLAGAVPLVVAVVVFVLAVALVTAAIEGVARRGRRSPTLPALAFDAGLVAAFMAYGSVRFHHGTIPGHGVDGFYVLLALAACAMGTQAATVTKWGSKTIRTTYVSGMMTRFAQNVVNALAPRRDDAPSYLRDQLGLEGRAESARAAVVYLALWSAFLGGAVLGAWAELRFALWSLAFPLGALVLAVLADLRRPVTGEDSGAAPAGRDGR